MTDKQFKIELNKILISIKEVLDHKAAEYAIGDRLYNFKRAAEISRTSPGKALIGMFIKHLVSVMDIVEDSLPITERLIEEKVGDARNYLILLEILLKEEHCQSVPKQPMVLNSPKQAIEKLTMVLNSPKQAIEKLTMVLNSLKQATEKLTEMARKL